MRAEPKYESKFQWLARLGFFTRGLLYITIAFLVIGTGRTEDVTGAMEYLGHGVGRALLIVITVGMIGYGMWRLADAAFGMDSGRHHPKAWRRRAAAAGSGAVYVFLAYKAVRILLAGRSGSADVQDHAETALRMQGGPIMLVIAGAVLAVAGCVQIHKAGSCSFLNNLDDRAKAYWAKWLGRIGYAARGVIFLTIGYLVGRSGIAGTATGAGGVEQALDALSDPMEIAVASGLMLFGIYSIIEARFRSIHKPPVEHIKQEVKDALRR